jgi:hypothetical protein
MSADQLLWAIAAHGLPGTRLELPAQPLKDRAFRGLLHEIDRRRVAGLALRAAVEGSLPVTPTQIRQLAEAHSRVMIGALRIERALLSAVDLLESTGIDVRALKGSFSAHALYPSPADRVFGDVDLLVRSEDLDAAVELLQGQGYERLFPQLRRGFDRRYGKAVTLQSAEGVQIDLHRTFLMGPHGLLLDTGRLFESWQEVSIGGRTIKGLDWSGQALHASYTVAVGDATPKPTAVRDLAELLLHRLDDHELLLGLAADAEATALVARAVKASWQRLDLADSLPITRWAQRYEPSRRERTLMRSYLGRRRSYATKAFDSIRVLPTARDRLAYLVAVAVPTRSFLAQQGETPLRWLSKGSRALVRGG